MIPRNELFYYNHDGNRVGGQASAWWNLRRWGFGGAIALGWPASLDLAFEIGPLSGDFAIWKQ